MKLEINSLKIYQYEIRVYVTFIPKVNNLIHFSVTLIGISIPTQWAHRVSCDVTLSHYSDVAATPLKFYVQPVYLSANPADTQCKHNVAPTSMQRHNAASTLMRRIRAIGRNDCKYVCLNCKKRFK